MSIIQIIPSTPQRLAGRTTIATSGPHGIGAAIAHRLATDGAQVTVVYRNNATGVDTVVNRTRSAGAQAIAIQADVGDAVSVGAVVSTVREALGAIDTLVSNTSILKSQPVGSIDLTSFDAQFHTNAFSTILVARTVLPHVPVRGGHIVNMSSNLVYRPRAGLAMYAANKAAVGAPTHAFAVELSPWNITVSAVAPALTRTDVTTPIPDEVKAHMHESIPMNCLAGPDDITDAIAFLASDDARWITGHTLMTDDGFIQRPPLYRR